MFYYESMLDKTFRISLILKGLDGVLELIGGVALFFVSPAAIQHVARALTQHELSQDPHDFIATHIIHFANASNASSTFFGALYLLTHGLVKIVLVVAVLKNRLWAYPWMIAFLLVFIVYQVYRLSHHFSVGLLLLTLFDVFIVWLTVLEYRRHTHQSKNIPEPLAH